VRVLIAASTADVLLPAVFGVVGTLIGALIGRDVAVRQHRADKDADVRLAGAKCLTALDELRDENNTENVRSARATLMELGHAAISAGFDTRLARGVIRYGSQNIRNYADVDFRMGMNADPLELAGDSAATLIAAVDHIPYRHRRGPFMDSDLKLRAHEFNVLDDIFNPIREQPYTGLMWRLARFLERLRRFKRWIGVRLRRFKRWIGDLFSGIRRRD
jgi:hypothetical protein